MHLLSFALPRRCGRAALSVSMLLGLTACASDSSSPSAACWLSVGTEIIYAVSDVVAAATGQDAPFDDSDSSYCD